jgi:hypothetical protein
MSFLVIQPKNQPFFIQQLHPPATTVERELEKAQSSIDEGIG